MIKRKDIDSTNIAQWKSEGKSDQEIANLSRRLAFGIGPVYDISSTEPIPGWTDENGNSPYEPKEWRKDSNDSLEEIEVLVNAAIRWAKKNNINVAFETMSAELGGYSSGGDVKINDTYEGINKFSTLVHECAHEGRGEHDFRLNHRQGVRPAQKPLTEKTQAPRLTHSFCHHKQHRYGD